MAFSYKSAISFGLVFIPVRLHAAAKAGDIGFNMLEKNTMSRIRYKKTCADCDGKEVEPDDIVRAFQYQKDRYIVITDEELERIKTNRDKTIAIEKFVDIAQIDPIYYDKAYYVEPTGAPRAFSLLLAAMKKQNKAGIARSVLGSKESLIAVRALGDRLVACTLFFDEEVQRPSFALPDVPVAASELKLAETIIQSMTDTFDPAQYHNEYRARLTEALNAKIAGQEIQAPKAQKSETITDLMEALQKSLNQLPPKQEPDTTAGGERRSDGFIF